MISQRNKIGTGLRIQNKRRKDVKVEWKNYKIIKSIGLYRIKN